MAQRDHRLREVLKDSAAPTNTGRCLLPDALFIPPLLIQAQHAVLWALLDHEKIIGAPGPLHLTLPLAQHHQREHRITLPALCAPIENFARLVPDPIGTAR